MAHLASIVYRPKNTPPAETGYTRLPLEATTLIAGYGIEGDARGGTADRNLNIMCAETVAALGSEGFQIQPGQLGEQLIFGGLEVDNLPKGTRIRIGESACVELTIPRTGCAKFERYQGLSPQQAAGRMGMMANVITGGPIRVGDPVTVSEA